MMHPPPPRPPPPPPPPPPPTPPQPSYSGRSSEPYGAVHVSRTPAQTTRRRSADVHQQTAAAPYYMPSPPPVAAAAYSAAPSSGGLSMEEPRRRYQHNVAALIFLIPVLSTLWWNPSPYPLQVFLFLALALYAVDLANERDMTALGVWISFAILSITNAWCTLAYGENENGLLSSLLRVSVETLLFLGLACLCALQFQWLYQTTPSFAIKTERLLHSMLPPVSASVVTLQLSSVLEGYWGTDRAATFAPYLFALSLACGMLFLGCCHTSFSKQDDKKDVAWALSVTNARMHSVLLLLVPPLFHIIAFRRRIVSSLASSEEWYDIILAWSIPYLLQYGMGLLHHSGVWKGPYAMSSFVFPQSGNTLRGAIVPMVVSVVASLALQQRHLIPWCHFISYQFNGHDMPSSFVVSLYLTLSTVLILLSIWIWGRTSAHTGEPLFGEYHDDIVQLSLGLSGMFAGKAIGMPWTLTPLPVLAFLGLSVWITTRMLRFLAIVLFALHSAAALIFSYRFAGIDYPVVLSIGIPLSLVRLGMLIVFCSVLVGLVTGLAVRPAGGVGAEFLKKVDMPGILLIVYGMFLVMLECTLLKEPVPFRDLADVEGHEDVEIDPDATMYTSLTALFTSGVLVAITWFMKRFRIISPKSTVVALSVAIGKAIAVIVDMNGVDEEYVANKSEGEEGAASRLAASRMLLRSQVAALTLLVMLAPRAFLTPVHIKSSGAPRYKRSLGPSGKPVLGVPQQVRRTIFVYALVILPIVLVLAVPLVINPLIGLLSGRYSGAYYSVSPGVSELIGFASALWGVSCLSMVNHYLPDGGGEAWKKASALTFLMGLGITLSAPTLPDWIGSSKTVGTSSPFASISSLGSTIATTSRSRSGGWGLVASALATLLALTGPLELRERRDPSGRKDKSLLFRLMVFSLLFGGGVSWFIALQFMSEESFLPVFLTTTSCMAISFFGTIAGVMGYFLQLEEFDEVEQVVTVWAGAFPVFLVISGASEFVKEKAHPFGIGGWLSTYLFVCACVALAFSLAMRSRTNKNAATRGIGNLSCIISYIFSIIMLHGRFGVAGLDAAFDVTLVFGVPASVFGTCLVSLILLALEGESSAPDRRHKIQRLGAPQKRPKSFHVGLNLKHLHKMNRLAPPVAATIVVLLGASFYGVLFRGCGWLLPGASTVPTSHEDVFASIYGMSTRATSAKSGDDLASLAEKNLIHSQAMVIAARLAGCGFWTADSIFGPLLHLGGILATVPSLYLLIDSMWTGQKVPVAKATLALPLNLIPLVLCRGLPPLRILAIIGGLGGLIQLGRSRHQNWQSKMTI